MLRDQSPGSNDWRVDDVPGDEPHLHFVGTDDIADQQVIGARWPARTEERPEVHR